MSQLYASLLYIGSTTTGDGTMDAALPSPNSMYTIIGVLSGVIVLVIIVSTVIIVIVVSIKKPKTRYEFYCYNLILDFSHKLFERGKICDILNVYC